MIHRAFCLLLFSKCILVTGDLTNSQEVNFTKYHETEVKLKTDLLRNYSVDALPPHTSTKPTDIYIYLTIQHIDALDSKTQAMTGVYWLGLEWVDSRLRWNSSEYDGIKAVRFAVHKLWIPHLYLHNSANMNSLDEVNSDELVLLRENGGLTWIPPLTLSSLCEIDLKYYPYDTHNCALKFHSWTYDGEHLDLRITVHEVDVTTFERGEWEIVTTSAVKSSIKYDACCNKSYPEITFSFLLRRHSSVYIAIIGSPLIAATFLLLISLRISPLNFHRVMLNMTSLFTCLALLMHLTSTLAAVGKETPLVMNIWGILLILNVLATINSIAFKTIADPKKAEQPPQWIIKFIQNRILNNLFIRTLKHMGSPNESGETVNLVADDGQVLSHSRMPNSNNWMAFFQVIDLAFFIACAIIIIYVIFALKA